MQQKILVVDDEQDMLSILKRSLSRQGHTVHTATSGDEAWKIISKTMYNLVISDLAMMVPPLRLVPAPQTVMDSFNQSFQKLL